MALLVSPPQGRNSRPTILASNHHGRVLPLALQRRYVDRIGIFGHAILCRSSSLVLQDAQIGALCDAVIECRTATASIRTTGAIATSTARARPSGHVILSHVLRPSGVLNNMGA